MESRVKLSQVCDAIVDCEHKTAPTQPFGIPSIRTTNIKNGRIDFKNANRVSIETYQKWTARLEPQPEDLILAREAPVGEVGIIPSNQKACLGQRTVLIRTNQQKLNSRYLLYLLLTPKMHHEMICKAEGSTVPHLNMSDIRNLEIPKPPSLLEQKAIARILGTLDDKIELNQQMNRTLEATARAIFKSWFVDFDPVRAKMDGRQPEGMDAQTAALFPDAFVDSELGMIPKEWEVIKLDREIQITKGRSYKSSELTPSATALVTLKSFQRGGGYRPDGLKPYTGKYKPEQIIKPGELVVAYTDLTQAADVIGKPAIVKSDNEYEILVASLDLGIVRPKTQRLNIPFLYYLFSQEDFQNHVYAHVNGSTVLHLNKDGIPSYEFCCPPSQLIDKFYELVNPIFSKTDAQEQESISLANLRDTLLPKLMSGEIRVVEAEKMVEDVA